MDPPVIGVFKSNYFLCVNGTVSSSCIELCMIQADKEKLTSPEYFLPCVKKWMVTCTLVRNQHPSVLLYTWSRESTRCWMNTRFLRTCPNVYIRGVKVHSVVSSMFLLRRCLSPSWHAARPWWGLRGLLSFFGPRFTGSVFWPYLWPVLLYSIIYWAKTFHYFILPFIIFIRIIIW